MTVIKFKKRSEHWLLRIIDRLFPSYRHFWTTLGTIYHPDNVDPKHYPNTIRHEVVHIGQQEADGLWWFLVKYIFLPFPVFFAYYRVKYEAEAYAENILTFEMSEEDVVDTLWRNYGFPLPKPWMRRIVARELRKRRSKLLV